MALKLINSENKFRGVCMCITRRATTVFITCFC